jgi:AraC-like DNA-binding protein
VSYTVDTADADHGGPEGGGQELALLVDTRTLPAVDRIEAANAALSSTDVPAIFRYDASEGEVGHRLDYWDLGPGAHITRIVGSGLGITRGPKQLRAAAPERIGLGFQLRIVTAFTHLDTEQVLEPGDLSLTDGTSTCEAFWPGGGGSKMVLVDYDRLGLPVDLVRRAVPHLGTSPVYQLVRAHVATLCQGYGDVELGPEKAMLRVATIELIRALITTAAQDELGQQVLHDTLYLRVSKYVDRHLAEPDLNAENIALAHHISIRTLYNAWSAANQVPLSQWIIAARLEGARAQLSGGTQAMTIAAVARRWGFADATHFARRFRRAYGLSPREWRQLHLPSADGRASVGVTGRLP